jgi:hypothetical protein
MPMTMLGVALRMNHGRRTGFFAELGFGALDQAVDVFGMAIKQK